MREIKFRVWDKKDKIVHQRINLAMTLDGQISEVDFLNGGVWQGTHHSDDRYLLLQYTGLKDRNGKEIYESDIVYVRHMLVENMENFTAEIIWDIAGFKVDKKLNHFIGYPLSTTLDGIAYELEVLGNSYENPELLINT